VRHECCRRFKGVELDLVAAVEGQLAAQHACACTVGCVAQEAPKVYAGTQVLTLTAKTVDDRHAMPVCTPTMQQHPCPPSLDTPTQNPTKPNTKTRVI
jgi:hypothetical protein